MKTHVEHEIVRSKIFPWLIVSEKKRTTVRDIKGNLHKNNYVQHYILPTNI